MDDNSNNKERRKQMKVKELIQQLKNVDENLYVGWSLWKNDGSHIYYDPMNPRQIERAIDAKTGFEVVVLGHCDDCIAHQVYAE